MFILLFLVTKSLYVPSVNSAPSFFEPAPLLIFSSASDGLRVKGLQFTLLPRMSLEVLRSFLMGQCTPNEIRFFLSVLQAPSPSRSRSAGLLNVKAWA